MSSFTIVTACDERYWRTAEAFFASAARRRLHRGHRFVCYDLGLDPMHRRALERRFPWCQWRTFDFTAHPPHFRLSARTYAWKPWVIGDVVRRDGGLVLWLDSATLFHTQDLSPLARHVDSRGIYTLRGKKTLREGCALVTLERAGCPKELWHERIRVSGVVGLNAEHSSAQKVLARWQELATDPACNLPPGPAHSADQSLLSMALYMSDLALHDEDIDISSGRPVRWMSSRNKLAPSLPRIAVPFAHAYYRSYKTIDQALWRAKELWATRAMGLSRWPKEHFTVHLEARGARREVRSPRGSYYADPFLLGDWLFLEEFRYALCRGRIVARRIGDDLSLGPVMPALELSVHCSFPFVFREGATVCMVPETSHRRTVDLFVCEALPSRWRLARRLLADIDAADSILLQDGGRAWLLTSVLADGKSQRHLEIYHAESVFSDEWKPHPVNRRRLYADAAFGYGRSAGRPRLVGGKWHRPIHTSRRFYGESIGLARIETLTEDDYVERLVSDPVSEGVPANAHHADASDALRVWDVRDRVSYRKRSLQ